MTVRRATEADASVLRELWEEFAAEVPPPTYHEGTWEAVWEEFKEHLADGVALLAEEGGQAVGYALGKLDSARVCFLSDLYVRPEARRDGVAKALMAEVAAWGGERGAQVMRLEIMTTNALARAVYERLGFTEQSQILVTALPALVERLAERRRGDSFGSIHVQTDDREAVARAVRRYVPRLPGGSKGSVVIAPRNGWTAVYDELCDREPAMLRRLSLEISDRMGAVVLTVGIEEGAVVRYVLIERGSIVDEYASLPEYDGPLPPGDVIALGANPTVAARLTGADPRLVRETARVGSSPSDLPPPAELLVALAAVLGIEGAEHGYAAARDLPGALVLDR